jgi:uncharacterized OB-fold protein
MQAVFCDNVLGDFEEGQGMIQSYLADDIGCDHVPATRFEGACASGTMAMRDAFMWVASGFYDIVLAGGTERATAMGTSLATRSFAMFADSRYEYPAGMTFPAFFALLAHLYADRYKIPLERLKEQMALVSVQSHHYGARNPHGQFKKEISVQTVLNSFMVTTPLQLFDCCPFSDGAAAVVLASEAVARKRVAQPVFISGVGQASSGRMSSQYKYLPRIRARELSVQQAYRMAGVGPGDIDVCELHDCFSDALQRDLLTGLSCRGCGQVTCPPRMTCLTCGGCDLEKVNLCGRGTIRSLTTTFVAPLGRDDEAPYTIVLVELDEGPWIIGNLIGVDPAQVGMDMIGRGVKMGHKIFAGDRYSAGEAARPVFCPA